MQLSVASREHSHLEIVCAVFATNVSSLVVSAAMLCPRIATMRSSPLQLPLCGRVAHRRVFTTQQHHVSKLKESDYRKFLSFKTKGRSFAPFDRLTGLSPRDCAAALPLELKSDPLGVFEDPNASLETVSRALECYVSKSDHVYPARQEDRKRYIRDQPGQTAVAWLLRTQDVSTMPLTLSITLSTRLRDAIAFSLVAEGAEHVMRDWTYAAAKAVLDLPELHDRNRARSIAGHRLRGLVEATAFWTPKEDPFEDALAPYFDAMGSALKYHIAFSSVGQFLSRSLQTPHGSRMSSKDFDRFTASLDFLMRNDSERQYNLARLALYHPRGGDGMKMLEFVQKCIKEGYANDACPFVRSLLQVKDHKTSMMLFLSIVHAAQVLDHNHQQKEARILLDLGRQTWPSLFPSAGPPDLSALERDRHTAGRRATASELAMGVQVDENGCPLPPSEWHALEDQRRTSQERPKRPPMPQSLFKTKPSE